MGALNNTALFNWFYWPGDTESLVVVYTNSDPIDMSLYTGHPKLYNSTGLYLTINDVGDSLGHFEFNFTAADTLLWAANAVTDFVLTLEATDDIRTILYGPIVENQRFMNG